MPVRRNEPSPHPASYDDPAEARKAAAELLRLRTGHEPQRVFFIEIDRIAYVNHEGRAMTAILSENDAGHVVIPRIHRGWPINDNG